MNNDGAVLLSGQKSRDAVANFGGRQIRNYVGWGSGGNRWRYHPALRRGQFNRWDAWAMLQSDAVQIGMLALMSPFPSVTWEVRANSSEIKTFVENQIHRFWTHDLQKVLLQYMPHDMILYQQQQ